MTYRLATRPTLKEVAGIADGRDITRPFWEPTLRPQDKLLIEKGGYGGYQALDVWKSIRSDDQVKSVVQQRLDTLIGYETEVVAGQRRGSNPGRAEKKARDYTQELINGLQWDEITKYKWWGNFYGYSIAELMLCRDGQYVVLDDTREGIRVRDRSRFVFDRDFNCRLLTPENNWEGELIDQSRLWVYSTGADHSDDPYGFGLAHWLYWLVIFKRGGFRHWLKYLEYYADPKIVGKYPANLPSEDPQVDKLMEALNDLATGNTTAISDNMLVEYLETARSGTADYEALIDQCNAAISKVILSQTMTTDNGSSLSQAKVHENVALSVIKADCDLINGSFNKQVLARRLCHWNFPDAAPPKVRRITESPEDLHTRIDRDAKLFDLGIRITPEAVARVYGRDYQAEEKKILLLNSEQLTSLNQLVKDAASGALPVESAKAIMQSALGISEEISNQIMEPIAQQQQEQQQGQQQEQEDIDNLFPEPELTEEEALFAEFYEFASSPGGVPVKKNCTKGVYCIGKTGIGSCIQAGRKCRKKMVEGSQDYVNAIAPGAKAAETSPTKMGKIPDINPDMKAFWQLSNGVAPDGIEIAEKDITEAGKWLDRGKWNENKIQKMQADSQAVTDEEGLALANWLGHKYTIMSRRMWDPDALEEDQKAPALTADLLTAKALHKLPPATLDSILEKSKIHLDKDRVDENGLPFKETEATLKERLEKPLNRFMALGDNAQNFVQRYKDALEKGGGIEEENFFGTTHHSAGNMTHFSEKANVIYKVKAKLDGTGQGRYVDHFKNQADEGEILFPPYSKFKVTQVDDPPKEITYSPKEQAVLDLVARHKKASQAAIDDSLLDDLFADEDEPKKENTKDTSYHYEKLYGKKLPSHTEIYEAYQAAAAINAAKGKKGVYTIYLEEE